MATAIEFENVGKQYRLGLVSTRTLSHDLERWWTMNILHKEDPYLTIGETNDRATKGQSEYVWALRDINFKVEQGDVVGIIGRNGAGKSTLLKLLSKVTGPTTGCIRARGRIGSLLEVGTGFHGEMTGRENIFMNGAILGMTKPEIARKLDEIIDFSGCERYIDTPVKRYSSGMTVRLGFAVAAFLDPEILVVDEVLAVGDAEFQKKAIGKMQDVSQGEGRTVLFVSHNMASVKALCRSGILLEKGMVSYSGSIENTIDEYMKSSIRINEGISIAEMPRGSKVSEKIKFIDLEYYDKKGELTTPRCGQYLKIKLHLKVLKPGFDGCHLALSFYNLYGDIMMTFRTEMTIAELSLNGGDQYICLEINKFPLTAGEYRMLLWSDVKQECADFIDKSILINVEDDDFFGLGVHVPERVLGKVMLYDHKWILE